MARNRVILLAAFFLFTVVFLIYYPPTCAIVDESAYLSATYAFQHGTVFYDHAGINQEHMSLEIGGHQVSRYPPGNSLLLLPFTLIHWRFVFIRGWILAGIAYCLMILCLRHYRLPVSYAVLLLFHPTFILYSRTIMSDLPALVFILAGLYAGLHKKAFIAGLLFGLSAALRYPNLIIPAAVAAFFLFKKEIRLTLIFIAGVILGVLPLLIYNLQVFGSWLGSVPVYGTSFDWHYLPHSLSRFALSLMLLYPGLLIIFFLWRSPDRWYWWSPVLLTMLFYSFQDYREDAGHWGINLVMNLRYLLPVIPVLLLSAAGAMHRYPQLIRLRLPAFALLSLSLFYISHRHQDFLREKKYYQDHFYAALENTELVLANKDIGEMINPFRRHIPWRYYEYRRRPKPIDQYRHRGSLMLACLTSEEEIRKIFQQILDDFPDRIRIVEENQPKYFSLWRVDQPGYQPNNPNTLIESK